MRSLLALSPFFGKGLAVFICSMILFVGSVYVMLAAVFGLRMGYLVLAVSFFGWMIILSALWTFGAPGTPPNLGPRGVEPHWQVFAAGTLAVESRFPPTRTYPDEPWEEPDAARRASVDSAMAVIQDYMAARANEALGLETSEAGGGGAHGGGGGAAEDDGTEGSVVAPGEEGAGGGGFQIHPEDFVVEDFRFATVDGTELVGARAFFARGGRQVTVFAYYDKGSVPVYSIGFLIGSVLGFLIHLPFLDRAERRRKEILTGGTAPAWYGPA